MGYHWFVCRVTFHATYDQRFVVFFKGFVLVNQAKTELALIKTNAWQCDKPPHQQVDWGHF